MPAVCFGVKKSGHESRLNRPMEGKFGSPDYAREELRAAIAAMLIGGELKIGHSFGQHATYSGTWAKILKDDPFEISRAAADAQKIVSRLTGAGQKQEINHAAAVSTTLGKGDEIPYNNTVYKVLDKKGKTFEIEKGDTGEKFKANASFGIFKNLLEAKNNPQQQQQVQEPEVQEENSYKIGR